MKIGNILYYGVQVEFPVDMVKFWKHYYPESRGYKAFLHHITLGHRDNMTMETLLPVYMNRGEKAVLEIDAVGRYGDSDGNEVVAFRVKDNLIDVDGYSLKGENRVFHITAFTKGSLRPVDSNRITDWMPIGKYSLSGTVKIWAKEDKS